MSLDTSDFKDTSAENTKRKPEDREVSFAETAMRLGNKSEDEARRMGAVDSADEQVERLFAPEYQTVNSPIHRAVWDRELPGGFVPRPCPGSVAGSRTRDEPIAGSHSPAKTVGPNSR